MESSTPRYAKRRRAPKQLVLKSAEGSRYYGTAKELPENIEPTSDPGSRLSRLGKKILESVLPSKEVSPVSVVDPAITSSEEFLNPNQSPDDEMPEAEKAETS